MSNRIGDPKVFEVKNKDGKARKIAATEVVSIKRAGNEVLVTLGDSSVWISPKSLEETQAWQKIKSHEHLEKVGAAMTGRKK